MDMTEYIRLCLVKSGNLSVAELARRTEQTSQNLSNKITRNNFKVSELEKIAEALDCELNIQFLKKDTKEPLI